MNEWMKYGQKWIRAVLSQGNRAMLRVILQSKPTPIPPGIPGWSSCDQIGASCCSLVVASSSGSIVHSDDILDIQNTDGSWNIDCASIWVSSCRLISNGLLDRLSRRCTELFCGVDYFFGYSSISLSWITTSVGDRNPLYKRFPSIR